MRALVLAAALVLAPCLAEAQVSVGPSTRPNGVTSVPTAGTTSSTAGTFTTALAGSALRKGCLIQNTSSSVLYVYLGATASATTAASVQVSAGGSFGCTAPGAGIVVQDNLAIASAGVSSTYVVVAQ